MSERANIIVIVQSYDKQFDERRYEVIYRDNKFVIIKFMVNRLSIGKVVSVFYKNQYKSGSSRIVS